MCSVISLSGAACCRWLHDFYGHKGYDSSMSLQLWLLKLASVALIQTRTHDGSPSGEFRLFELNTSIWKVHANLPYHLLSWSRDLCWSPFLSHSLLYLKLHTVCGFKPFHAPLTTRYPSERSGSHSQVFGCIFHCIFLFMPLIYDGPLAARRRLTLT